MKKELTIKVDLEQKRELIYELIYDYLDMNYTFSSIDDYQWFIKNIANKNELIDALDYNYLEEEGHLFCKVTVNVVYNFDSTVIIKKIELIIPKEIDIPKFNSGEYNND